MLLDFIRDYTNLAINTYHVNPVVLLTIYIASIPIFYLSLFFVVKELIELKKTRGALKFSHFKHERNLIVWSIVLLVDYLSPYIYILIFGENLPVYIWLLLAILIIGSVISLLSKVKSNIHNKK